MEIDKVLQDKIDLIKQEGGLVRKVKISGREYIYRSINRNEWMEFQKELEKLPEDQRLDKNVGEDKITKKFVIYGLDDMPSEPTAGTVSQLAELILMLSGFGALEEEPEEL